jgi:hypothetical protein
VTPRGFELVLFSVDPDTVRAAVAAGVESVIVDWEYRDKHARQAGANTEINRFGLADLARVRAATDAHVIVRINAFGEDTAREVRAAVERGADEILLPMVRTVGEVEKCLDLAAGRCPVGILVETIAACHVAERLGRLPLARVYMGFNDLAIDRGSTNIFQPLVDGTVDTVRRHFRVPFGFAGLTRADGGEPIPCRLLIAELARHECSFTFLRRSFHRDVPANDYVRAVPTLLGAIDAARRLSREALHVAHNELARRLPDSRDTHEVLSPTLA